MVQYARYPTISVTASISGAVDQGNPNASVANAWPVKPTDGTNSQAFTAAGAAKVDGSAVTQPISAASLPLPTGAATAAKQPALGTAGSASADVITVQGIASMTALKVDGSAVTQPVSAAALPLPSGAATSALQTTGNTSLATIATNTPAVGQATMAASSPVVIASNQSAVPVSQSGSWTVGQTGSWSVSLTNLSYGFGLANSSTVQVIEGGRSAAWQAYYNYGSSGSVSTSAYTQLVSATPASATRIRIFDSSGSAMIIATGASGSEVPQIYLPPGGSDGPYELYISNGQRVAIKALDTTASTGSMIITALS